MRIGITERGDAGLDFSWYDQLSAVDGAILITKNINDKFSELLLSAKTPTILHCTCTGWGGTLMEPNVPPFRAQIDSLNKLINTGYPAERTVLRIDPIFMSSNGFMRLKRVLSYAEEVKLSIRRIRISIYDDYPHTRERIAQVLSPEDNYKTYSGRYAPAYMYDELVKILNNYGYTYETCAEDRLVSMMPTRIVPLGCVSTLDLDIMKIPYTDIGIKALSENPQGRKGCHCLSCKTELLKNKYRCPHGCLYCYWKDK